MIIKSISIRNFKSFGNNKQVVHFKEDGELILLTGDNGDGKSSFQESFDFSLFGTVRGNKIKRIPIKTLPNRTNKNLELEITFVNDNSDEIRMLKCVDPTMAKVFINNIDKTSDFKKMKSEERDKLIGFNFETYKSFVSMSISDFTNFIYLTPEEKRKLVNKLFNLEEIDKYMKLTKDIENQYIIQKLKYETVIKTNEDTIKTYKNNITNIRRAGIVDRTEEIKRLKKEIQDKKPLYQKLKEENDTINKSIIKYNNKIEDLSNKKGIIDNDILKKEIEMVNIDEKIDIYNSGVCPICDTDLKDKDHKHNLNDMNENKKSMDIFLKEQNKERDDIFLKISQTSNQKETDIRKKNKNIIELKQIIYDIKLKHKKVTELSVENNNNISISEINNNIKKLEDKNSECLIKITEVNKKISTYVSLKEVFSVKGVRKSVISNIIKPLNVYVKDILDQLNSRYNIKLDDEFNAKVYERLINEVHRESLSVGETKKINISIALSYLKLILTLKSLNILFLDEIFSSMSPKNVELTLKVLKEFSKEHNMNIIIVDPKVYFNENSVISYDIFDRIIKVERKLSFSNIEVLTGPYDDNI